MDRLTIKAQEAVKEAQEVARQHSNQALEPEHLMAALLAQSDSLVPALLEKLGIPAKYFRTVSGRKSSASPRCAASRRTFMRARR